MESTLRTLRKTSALPLLAMGLSTLLVLVQVFHCCRINEAVSALVGHALSHLGEEADPEMCEGRARLVQQHADCHGPESAHGKGHAHPIQPDEPCLAEADLSFKAVEPGIPSAQSPLPVLAMRHAVPAARVLAASPRAPDAFAVPTYLLTLRLLV